MGLWIEQPSDDPPVSLACQRLSVLELAVRRPLFPTYRQKMKWASGVSVFTVVTLFILVHLHPEIPANLRTDTSWQLMFGGLLIVMTIGASVEHLEDQRATMNRCLRIPESMRRL